MSTCIDSVALLCFDDDCPSPSVDCRVLSRGGCHMRFGEVFTYPPTWRDEFVYTHCRRSCGYCSDACTNPDQGFAPIAHRLDTHSLPQHLHAKGVPWSWQHRPLHTVVDIHEPMRSKHVIVLQGSRWSPAAAPFGCGSQRFRPMRAYNGGIVSCHQCEFDHETTEAMVDALSSEHGTTIASTYRVGTCRAIRDAYTTRTNWHHSPDEVHFDICDPAETARRISRGYQRRKPFNLSKEYIPLTAISFPHTRWPANWGGPLEFVSGTCSPSVTAYPELDRASASLRILPLPQRTVVFRADLLHRATRPEDAAGVAVDGIPGGNRFSTVLRMLCEREGKAQGPTEVSFE